MDILSNIILFAVTGSALVDFLIALFVGALIFYLLWWFIGYAGLPEPFNKVARVVIAAAAVFFLINLVLGLFGSPLIKW